jgi:hypothetical protein
VEVERPALLLEVGIGGTACLASGVVAAVELLCEQPAILLLTTSPHDGVGLVQVEALAGQVHALAHVNAHLSPTSLRVAVEIGIGGGLVLEGGVYFKFNHCVERVPKILSSRRINPSGFLAQLGFLGFFVLVCLCVDGLVAQAQRAERQEGGENVSAWRFVQPRPWRSEASALKAV